MSGALVVIWPGHEGLVLDSRNDRHSLDTSLSFWQWHYIDNPLENNAVIHTGGHASRKRVSKESNKPHIAMYCHLLYEPELIRWGSGRWPVLIRFRIFTSTNFFQEIINCSNELPARWSDADKVGTGDSEQFFLCPAQQSTLGGQLQRCRLSFKKMLWRS